MAGPSAGQPLAEPISVDFGRGGLRDEQRDMWIGEVSSIGATQADVDGAPNKAAVAPSVLIEEGEGSVVNPSEVLMLVPLQPWRARSPVTSTKKSNSRWRRRRRSSVDSQSLTNTSRGSPRTSQPVSSATSHSSAANNDSPASTWPPTRSQRHGSVGAVDTRRGVKTRPLGVEDHRAHYTLTTFALSTALKHIEVNTHDGSMTEVGPFSKVSVVRETAPRDRPASCDVGGCEAVLSYVRLGTSRYKSASGREPKPTY